MHADVRALLTLQAHDAELDRHEVEARALAARLAVLDGERAAAAEALERARAELAAEERRERELHERVRAHRQLQEKFHAQLDQVRKPREAAAAMSQADTARRVLASEEGDLQASGARLRELRQATELYALALQELDENQRHARTTLAAEERTLEETVRATRDRRTAHARSVSSGALSRYERLRQRGRGTPLVPVLEASCGHCHVAIPLQRRHLILSGQVLETCEGCGTLLYAGD